MLLSFIVIFLFGGPEIQVTFPQLVANTIIVSPALHQKFVDGAYWSIVCELIFYGWVFLFKLVGVFDKRMIGILLTWVLISLLNELVIHSTALSWVLITKYSGFFALGVLLYHGRFYGWSAQTILIIMISFALSILQTSDDIYYHSQYYQDTMFSTKVGMLICLAMTLTVATVVVFEDCRHRRGLFLLIGGITYPLYLIHQNIGYIALNKINIGLPAAVILLMVSSSLVVGSWIIWRFIERPAQKFLKSKLALSARVT
jgi:peptidoglycan/LPS O-acetylase OafA/YrhL